MKTDVSTRYILSPLKSLSAFLPKLPSRSTLINYWQKFQTRKQLSRLTDTQLDDIGLTRAQAQAEAAKFFWQ